MSLNSNVSLIGLGCGNLSTLTIEGYRLLKSADLIIGAERLLISLSSEFKCNIIPCVKSKEILDLIKNEKAKNICVVFSGDSGFYSGAKVLAPLMDESKIEFKIVPGISSVQVLSSRLNMPWQDWKLSSAHGVDCDAVNEVMEGKPTFFLTGGKITPSVLCNQLYNAGLGDLKITVAENLTYPNEKIQTGSAESLKDKEFSPLSVMLTDVLIKKFPIRTNGFPDEQFIRGNVPMTKQEVRACILSKLAIQPSETVWDIGAGTGSVSIELALSANKGKCYAVECSNKGVELIRQNKIKFGAWNLNIIEGKAPEALSALPRPDAVFIGGTKGKLAEIIDSILSKNPDARICISAIAIETLSSAVRILSERKIDFEVTQISSANSKTAGSLHLMTANNPIFLICTKKEN